MEYADKGDLYQKITEYKSNGQSFEESDIWRIFIQLVKGLKSLHDLKILHRDLKSANVFLFNDGSAKLGDLNVSKITKKGLGYTQTGTPYYASPEVWNDQPYDLKSDIWSLGCVLYEMITLKPPFRAENMEGLFKKVTKGQYSKIPDNYSSDLSEVIKLLLQVKPESRPNCDQILSHRVVSTRIELFAKVSEGLDSDKNNILLQTIRIPKNLLFLSDKLPKSNYANLEKEERIQRRDKVRKSRKDEVTSEVKKAKAEAVNKEDSSLNVQDKSLVHLSPSKKKPDVEVNVHVLVDRKKKKEQLDPVTSIKKILERDKNQQQGADPNQLSPESNLRENNRMQTPAKNKLPMINGKNNVGIQAKRSEVSSPIVKDKYKVINSLSLSPNINKNLSKEHINKIYQIYAPYLIKHESIKYLSKGKPNLSSLKNIDLYYNYNNLKKIEAKNAVNRKLSPLHRK